MLRPLILHTEAACRHALEEIGFEWRSGRLVLDVNEEVVGSCGVSRVPHRAQRHVKVRPVIAVTHLPLEIALAELSGERPPSRYKSKSPLFRPVGYLMPAQKYTTWRFSAESDVDEVARELAAAVARYGLPFIRAHQTLEDFYESMITRRYGGLAQDFGYRLPLAALMLRKSNEARKHVEDHLEKLGGETHSFAEDYRRFAEGIAEHLSLADANSLRESIVKWRAVPLEEMIEIQDAVPSLTEEIERVARTNGMRVEWNGNLSEWTLVSEGGSITRQVDVRLLQDPARVDIAPYAFRDDAEISIRHYFRGPARAYGVYIPIKPSQFRDLLARVAKLVFVVEGV